LWGRSACRGCRGPSWYQDYPIQKPELMVLYGHRPLTLDWIRKHSSEELKTMIRVIITAILGAAMSAGAYAGGAGRIGFEGLPHSAIPEPMSLVLIGSCLMGLGLIGRHRGTEE
jgi:hypothetical protein